MPRKLPRERSRVDTEYKIRELDLDDVPNSQKCIWMKQGQGMSCLIEKYMYIKPIVPFDTQKKRSF